MSVRPDDESPDAALIAAVSGSADNQPGTEPLSQADVAERSGLPTAVLAALERQGLLRPRMVDGEPTYTEADVDALRAGLALLEAGVPLDELLNLARRHDDAMRTMADEAVEVFLRFVRDPIQGTAATPREASERLVAAFHGMMPATGAVVAHHFRHLLLDAAEARIQAES